MWTDPANFYEQPLGAPLDAADLLGREMLAERTEAAWLVPQMQRDLLEAVIEDPHGPRVPANPHAAAQVFGRGRIIGLGHLDVAIAIDRALGLLKRGEPLGRQRPQGRLLDFAKYSAHVLARGAMNPSVGDIRLPMRKMAILFLKALELAALESILLHVVDAAFHLTLVPWHVRLRGQDHDAVVPAERRHLRH